MDEDEWTDRNFGASTGDGEIGSSEELSDLSESEDDSEDDDQEGFAEALDVPLTADETRRLAEDWTRRYSNHKSGKSPGTTAKEEDGEDSESAHESDDSQGRYSTQEYDSEGESVQGKNLPLFLILLTQELTVIVFFSLFCGEIYILLSR